MLLSAGAVYLFLVVSADAQLVAVSSLFSFVSVGGWNALNIASAVHIPPALRSSAFGLFSAAGRLGAIAGNITFGLLVEANAGIPITIVASLLAVGAVFAVLLGAQSRPLETPSAAV
jgi:VNT family MFS transporter (synaptic vesicle glycoprotein 2)